MEYPKFLKNSPEGEDLFEGKSHAKIAETLFSLIRKKAIPNNVIGLEGKWGSGKSNIIKILEKKFADKKQDYVFYTYDTWAHQEDLTRKTFLDGLITHLDVEKKFKRGYDVTDLKKRVFSRITKTKVETQPKIKLYYIYILIAIFLFTLCNSLYDDFFGEGNTILGYDMPNLKKFIGRYLAATIFFILAILDFIVEVIAINKKVSTKSLQRREKLKRLLYVFSGTDVESENFSETVDEQPSIKDFKAYFKEIQKNINAKGLIIVFDNMDRLISKQKVLSIWSSIHTFFAEENLESAWVVVPYDKEHLASYFASNGNGNAQETLDNFIGKTFTTAFRVSPPVLSDWKHFFTEMFRGAFGPELTKNNGESTSSLYELINPVDLRKPRDIIAFINDMVALKLQHDDTVEMEYIALFCLRKSKILGQPAVQISSKEFMDKEQHLFQGDKELEENMAILVYNIDREKCSEVLLRNSIQDVLRKFDEKTLDALKQHTDFKTYFNAAMINSGLGNYVPDNVARVLDYLKDDLPKSRLTTYWEKFASGLDIRSKQEFSDVKEWHKLVMTNTKVKTSKKFGDNLIKIAKNEVTNDSGSNQYYKNLYAVIEHQKTRKISSKVEPVEFTPAQIVDFISNYQEEFQKDKCEFKEMKIYCDTEELDTYFVNHEDGFEEVAHKHRAIISFLKSEGDNYTFEGLNEKISDQVKVIGYNAGDEKILQLLEVQQAISIKADIITLLPETTGYNYLNSFEGSNKDLDHQIFANQIAHLKDKDARQAKFKEVVEEVNDELNLATIIQYYVSYSNLLKIYIAEKREYPLVAALIKEITIHDHDFSQSLDVKWAFQNLFSICNEFFPGENEVFLKKLDGWSHIFDKKVTESNIFGMLNYDVLHIIMVHWEAHYECIDHMVKKINVKILGLGKDEWKQILEKETIEFITISHFISEDKLDKKITRSPAFMDAYDDVLREIANRNIAIPEEPDSWKEFITKEVLDGRQLKRIFNGVLDIILDLPEVDPSEFSFFSYGLFAHASNRNRKDTSDEFIRKLILPLKDSKKQFDFIFEIFKENIVEVLKTAPGEYNEDLAVILASMKGRTENMDETINYIFENSSLNPVIKKEFKDDQ